MKRLGTIAVQFDIAGCEIIAAHEGCEISLDCFVCRRRARTVVFSELDTPGICTPTGHQFPGVLDEVLVTDVGADFRIVYEYVPFVDAKYPDETRYDSIEKGAPSWARTRIQIRCISCGRESEEFTQSNFVRPRKKGLRMWKSPLHRRCSALYRMEFIWRNLTRRCSWRGAASRPSAAELGH